MGKLSAVALTAYAAGDFNQQQVLAAPVEPAKLVASVAELVSSDRVNPVLEYG
ncbi:hypothetical protein H6G17_26275 [Chroococcidiopsis sp. FACHB-1243]|uniref:hypothetical protein n=1 Tax=Chroococcidiopsis sp. [FACHB-1243] TaxID=2692781 RepID=UPI00177C6020|nr:hypothetical protein [Chroococcidiopsis sp. [FACHB-1243]]MBD2308977.1 hypothetical protein [Chroococcidiopsis sp. [FACHB-1243]]